MENAGRMYFEGSREVDDTKVGSADRRTPRGPLAEIQQNAYLPFITGRDLDSRPDCCLSRHGP